jgi:MFS family permease
VSETPTMSPAAPDLSDNAVSTPVEGTLPETTVLVTEHEVLLSTAAALGPSLGISDDETPATAGPSRRRTWTLTVACMGVALVMSSMVALNTVLGDIAIATSATQTQLTWVVDSYTLVLACLLLPAGAIGDRYGRRCALLIGLGIFAIASLVPVILHTPLEIIASRAVAGVGAAFVMPATLSLLTAVYPKAQRAKAVGIWAGVAGSGAVLGMLGSGLLLKLGPWQSLFWALAGGGLLLFVLALTVSESRDVDAPPVDWPGAALIGTSVLVFVFGVIEAPSRGWSDPVVYGCLAAGLGLAAVFGFVECRRRHPLLEVRLFANAEFTTGAATITVLFLATFGFFFLLMQYCQLVLGYSPLQTALALTPLVVALTLLSGFSFWYLPKLGLRLVVFLGLSTMAVGFLCLQRLGLHSSYVELAWPLLVLSTGIGLCTAPATTAIMGATPDEKQGVASAVNDTARELGAALGFAIAGSMLAAQYARNLTPSLPSFPEPLRGAATDSLAKSIEVSHRLGPQGADLLELSRTAFLHAMQSSLYVMAGIVAVAAVVIGLWSPGRDGARLSLMWWRSGTRASRH